ncbi:MAG: hypothetical protein E7076_03720 [Bacteroidales bacterium]|nr:hypothetical protein [Bacteroidales bacterium]
MKGFDELNEEHHVPVMINGIEVKDPIIDIPTEYIREKYGEPKERMTFDEIMENARIVNENRIHKNGN